MGEFELIQRCFAEAGRKRTDVTIGIGDDGAVVQVREGCDLVITTDSMVEGIHFFRTSIRARLGINWLQ